MSEKERRNLPLKVPSSVAAGVSLRVKEPSTYTKQIQPVLKACWVVHLLLATCEVPEEGSKRFLAFVVTNI